MNSEKVKEIKKHFEERAKTRSCILCKENDELKVIYFADILTLINELESENEKLIDKCGEQSVLWRNHFNSIYKTAIENYKNRIAELEKEIKGNAFYAKGYAQGIKNTYEVVVPNKLKQFAERLKEKVKNFCGTEYENAYYDTTKSFACNDIDETLNEFLNK